MKLETSGEPQLVYIVGMGHSGSTLLELLLNAHPDVSAMGEVSLFSLQLYRDQRARWIGLCSCGARPNDCPVWGRVIESIRTEYHVDPIREPFSWRVSDVGLEEEFRKRRPVRLIAHKLRRYVRYLGYTRLPSLLRFSSERTRKRIERRDFLASEFAKHSGRHILVDASKDPIEMKDIAVHSRLPLKIVYLRRDARGVVWSRRKSRHSAAGDAARTWVRLNTRILKLLNTLDRDQWTKIAYEDLCNDPERTVAEILRFIGVDDASMLSTDQEFMKRHTIAGNEHRFAPLQNIREDTSWTETLTEGEIREVLRAAEAFRAKLERIAD